MALLARRALGAFAAGCGCRAFGRAGVMALAVAVVMRAALLGTAAGPPDFDQYRLGRRIGLGFGGDSFGGRFGGSGFRRAAASLAAAGSAAASGGACRLRLLFRQALQRPRLLPAWLRCGFDGAASTGAAGSSLATTGVTLGSSDADGAGSPDIGRSLAHRHFGGDFFRRRLCRCSRRSPRPAASQRTTVSTTTSGAGFGGSGGRLSMR